MNQRSFFFAELKRRNVIRAAGLYLVGAWLIVQVAGTVLPMFGAPDWLPRSIVILLVIGFLPAVIFSWVFELTPQGLKRDEDVPLEQSIAPQTGRRMDRMIIAVLLLALGYFAFDKFVLAPKREGVFAKSTEALLKPNESNFNAKSIAVLPFENLSSDKDNAYFAEGIQDEILTRLAKIGALKVISRTSTAHFASSPQNLPDIARQLGVANILEGSVQKAANAVHVNVQLIKAATDEHLWAESYDRELQNIFAVEGEVASAIAGQLNATLSGSEKQELAARPTKSPEAYDAYLRGLAFKGRIDSLLPNTLNSIQAFEDAVRLDPAFAPAWANLSQQHSFVFSISDRTPHRREAARLALDAALKLAPNLAETQLADGYYHYHVERDYEGAKSRFGAMRRQYPSNAEIPYALAAIARRQGDWQQSRLLFDQAVELNPQDVFLLGDAAFTNISMRDAAAAQKLLDRAVNLSPQNPGLISMQASALQLTGDVSRAQALLDRIQPGEGDYDAVTAITANAILLRKYASAIAILKAQLENPEALGAELGEYQNMLGDLQRLSGDPEASATYKKARLTLEASLRDQPNDPDVVSALAWTEAHLGEKAAAFAHARQAIALLPSSKDSLVGPNYEEALARIQAYFGDKDGAIPALQHLLVTFYGNPPVTPALLRIDPDWDKLRGDLRFEKLCGEKQSPK